jgi:4-amino-4-deoxy-L-arabinose transferase-like glycosyltransferase
VTATGAPARPSPARPAGLDAGWRGDRLRDAAAVAVPAALAAVLCFVGISARSVGFDEAATVTIASQHGSALWTAIGHDGGNMSGYYVLLHVLIGAFGDGLLVIRFVSALAMIAAVALVAVIGLRLFDRRVAVTGAVLAAVSLPLVYWAQNARGYAGMVAFVCAAYVAFVAIARQDGRVWPWIAYVVCMTLAIYFSFVAVLAVPAQLIMVVRRPRLAVRLMGALAIVAVCCTPLVVLATSRGSSQLFWVPRPTHKVETQVLQALTSAGLSPNFHATVTTTPLLILTLAGLVAVAAAAITRARRGEGNQWGALLVLSWCAVPVVLAWLESYVTQPIFVPRDLLMSVPPLGLALALGLWDRRLPRAVAVSGFAVLVGLRALQVVPSYGVSPEPWQQATAYVVDRSRPDDCIAFYPEDARMAFQYYVGTSATTAAHTARSILPVARWGVVRPYVEDYKTLTPAQIKSTASGCGRMWLVSSHEGELDGPPASLANRARYQELRAELERTYGRAPIKKFGYASAIHVQLLTGLRSGRQGRSVSP